MRKENGEGKQYIVAALGALSIAFTFLVGDQAWAQAEQRSPAAPDPATLGLEDSLSRIARVRRTAGTSIYSRDAIRFYGSPLTLQQLLDETGDGYPLLQSDESYGRESFVRTSRLSEPLTGHRVNGLLPLTDPLNGAQMANYLPIEAFESISLTSDPSGIFELGADHAASDVIGYEVEKFNAPIPYSRVHYTQVLARSLSNFDGLFSINASQALNLAFGLNRVSTGRSQNSFDPTFNPRVDRWNARAQARYAGITRDTTQPHDPPRESYSVLLWTNYMSGFSGQSGGLALHDSDDIFNSQLAEVLDNSTYDQRTRFDVLLDMRAPFITEEASQIGAYYTRTSRRFLSIDTLFPGYANTFMLGDRMGASISVPVKLKIGSFMTRAKVLGEFMHSSHDPLTIGAVPVAETRLSAGASDSMALEGVLGLSLFGYIKATQSTLTLTGSPGDQAIFPSVGLSGSIAISERISFAATYSYLQDRAAFSSTPAERYQIRNLGGFLDVRLPLGRRDSLALHAGILERHEPEGTVGIFAFDSTLTGTRFSSTDDHSQAALLSADLYVGSFRWSSHLRYHPAANPQSQFAAPGLVNATPQRFMGATGLYFEKLIAEGNLRLSMGVRARYMDRLDPTYSYDRISDQYFYQGPARSTTGLYSDSRLTTPKTMLDLLVHTEIDRRAQVNMSFLNITGTPYYHVALYPRAGFQWRLDVTWAFLD